jgi:N6-adenosine-specific RNA methylase IME4
MPLHPIAELFPLMEGAEFEALVESIRQNGLREPILRLPDGRIIDGRNRLRACEIAGVEPRYTLYTGDEGDSLLRLILDLNLHRRHLSESQRAMVAAKLATRGEGRLPKTRPIDPVSQQQVAALLNVSVRSIKRANVVKNQGTSELLLSVEKDLVPVSVAEKVAAMDPLQQRQFVLAAQQQEKPPHQILATMRRDQKRAEILLKAESSPDLPSSQRYPLLLIDPPWSFASPPMGHTDRSIENHYPTMSFEGICELPVKNLATQDAVLFLWVTVPQLEAGLAVMKEWSFRYVSHFVWIKDKMGMGYHTRNQHELLLIGRRGEIPLPEPEDRFSSVVVAARTAHSRKPVEFYEIIETMYPDYPKIELFSRGCRAGWTHWGWEANGA